MLYAFGSNGAGQLNVGHDEDLKVPTKCLLSHKYSCLKIIGGGNHTFIQVGSKVYLVGNDEPLYLPEVGVDSSVSGTLEFSNVHAFAATWDAFAVVQKSSSGEGHEIITFGSQDKGQLGREMQIVAKPSPEVRALTLPDSLSSHRVVDIVGGVQHFVVILDSGEVFGWGNGRKGQIGEPAGVIEQPRKIEAVAFPVKNALCGREFTVLLGESEKGEILVLGSDKWGVKSEAPQNVRQWKAAGAGWGSITVLLNDGSLICWGRNDHGQLAPSGIPPIEMIAVGSEHTIAMSAAGQILVWGWGEHGNCGADIDENGDVKGRWNMVSLPSPAQAEKVIGLGAGCATSWIWTGQGET